MLEDPGFWEYYQNYRERKVFAEGKLVLHEGLFADKFFKDYYFAHKDTEDLPGGNVFDNYVNRRFIWRRFETKVEDGQLTLTFDSKDAYANTMSALVVAPLSEDAKVQKFLHRLTFDEKIFFDGMNIENKAVKKPLPEKLKNRFVGKSFIPFVKNFNDELMPYDVPIESQIKDNIVLF